MRISRIIAGFLCIVLLLGFCLTTATAKAEKTITDPVSVFLNGEEVIFDVEPIIIDGRTMAPFRAIFEALGYKVDWESGSQTIKAENDSGSILMKIGDLEIRRGDETIKSNVAPFIQSGRTFVPVRIISELSGCDVLWNQGTKTVLIYGKQAEGYTPVRFTYSFMVSDDSYLYVSGQQDVPRAIRKTMQISLRDFSATELLPNCANDYFLYNGRLFGRFGFSTDLSYGAYDLTTGDTQDITETDVATCYIYNNQLYFTYLEFGPTMTTLYRMNLDGTDVAKLFDGSSRYPIFDYAIKDGFMFCGYMDALYVMPLATLEPIDLIELCGIESDSLLVSSLALSGDCFFASLSETKNVYYTAPLGILQYNYKTSDYCMIDLDYDTEEIFVTDNSIYFSVKHEYSDGLFTFGLYRSDINGANPVLLCTFETNQYGNWTIAGNYIYYICSLDDGRMAVARIASDGTQYKVVAYLS